MLLGGHGGVRVQGEARDESGRVGPGLTRTLPRWLGSVSSGRGATAWLPSLNKRSELEGGRGGGGGGLGGPWPRGWRSFLWWGGAADPEEALKPRNLWLFSSALTWRLKSSSSLSSFSFSSASASSAVGSCWRWMTRSAAAAAAVRARAAQLRADPDGFFRRRRPIPAAAAAAASLTSSEVVRCDHSDQMCA